MQGYIEGDLMEMYERRLEKVGKRRADIMFVIDVLLLFRPGIFRSAGEHRNPNTYGMYKSYFKIGWRNLARNRGYSFINIGGLAIGMTVVILIGLWIYDELSFNKYYQNYESIGQLWAGETNPETSVVEGNISVQYPVAATLRNKYGHYFKHVLMAWWITDYTLSIDDNNFIRTGEFIEGGALDMLSLKMLQGSHESLSDPHSIILSKSAAASIFGDKDPMNKSLRIDNRIEVQVTGVYEDIPRNNHFSEVDFFSPWSLWVSTNGWIKQAEYNWDNRSFNIYVQLRPNVNIEEVNTVIRDFYFRNSPEKFLEEFKKYQTFAQIIPMRAWHLYTEFEDGKPTGGRITFVWLFGIIGVFVLFLACINFVNLSTARSERRARETGIRKAIGSARAQLISQFLSESFLVTLVAFLISAILVALTLPWFNELADKDIILPIDNPVFWAAIITCLILTSLMAGFYPAFYLSSFQPVKVLKGIAMFGRFAALPRKLLVIIQFTVSVSLIIGTIVVYRQIQHARDRPIGYDRNNLISIRMTDPALRNKYDLVRNELLNTGFVTETAFSDNPLTLAWNNYGGFEWEGKDPNMDSDFTVCYISDNYGAAVRWQIVAGRDFDKLLASDSSAIIINEAAVRYTNLGNPIGEYITNGNGEKLQIIGVVRDLIMQSPYEPVKQTIFTWHKYAASNMIIRMKETAHAAVAVAAIENVFKKIVPSAAFDFKFVDDEFARKFSQEERIGKLARTFAVLAVFISVLGLFGLSSFVAEQRTKEIGVRKVMGASVLDLWAMLSKDFVALVMISCLVAVPTIWYLMEAWLLKYQYRTELSWWIILPCCLGTIILTMMTVSYQAIRAATVNPVKSLRSE
jgi:ABC-type antimicrobial peptide transport system permease subunit